MLLNEQQSKAINTITGPCLVLAGAGSGKTRVIINKIINLVRSGFKPENIYAVTFTNKAAKEMRERLSLELPSEITKKINISTFHTLGLKIIRREYQALNLKSKIILFDPHDQTKLLNELIDDGEVFDTAEVEVDLLRQYISKYKTEVKVPGINFIEQSTNKQDQKYAKLYEKYYYYMQSVSAVDFDDLIMLPTLLLRSNPSVLSKWQKRVDYILVDEYQDTNNSQLELVKLLSSAHNNFTVVGDDDQSIYSWRGAAPENIARLSYDFPNLQVFMLEQNYRSTNNILRAANVLIDNNKHLFVKKLFSNHIDGKPLRLVSYDNVEEEAICVVDEIIGHHHSNNSQYGHYAVLYRSNYQASLIEKYLIKEGIPYLINGDSNFFENNEIRDIIAFLRVLNNPDDDRALLRIINVPKRDIGVKTVESLGNLAKSINCSLFEACFNEEVYNCVRPNAYKYLSRFMDLLIETSDHLLDSQDFKVFEEFIDKIGYRNYIIENAKSTRQADNQLNNINALFSWIRNWMDPLSDDPLDVNGVVTRLFLREMFSQNNEEDQQAVQLMTIHASKGLEFPYVYMIGVEEDILPHKNSILEDNIEEERRLMYVGITRAKLELTISYNENRQKEGENMPCERSRFIEELPLHEITFIDNTDSNKFSKKREEMNIQKFKELASLLDS